MAVPFTQMATEALYNHSKELSDLISTNVGLIGMLGAKGRIEIITGGLGWKERVFYGTDPNAGHGSRYAQIDTNRLENMTMAQYDPAFFRTSIVINHVDRDMAKGDAALGDLVKDSWDIVKTYAVQKIATDLWASSQTNANYPIPLPIMVPATAKGSQTGTARGGISSTDNSWWRSNLDATAYTDIGASSTGLKGLQQMVQTCSRSSAKISQPDFGITTSALFSRIASTADANRRYIKDESMLKLGFDNIMFLNLTILWDAMCTAKYFYVLNSRKLKIKCLKQEHMQNINVDANQYSLPMVITPFVRDTDTANDVALMYLAYQLCANDLEGLGLLSNCTE